MPMITIFTIFLAIISTSIVFGQNGQFGSSSGVGMPMMGFQNQMGASNGMMNSYNPQNPYASLYGNSGSGFDQSQLLQQQQPYGMNSNSYGMPQQFQQQQQQYPMQQQVKIWQKI